MTKREKAPTETYSTPSTGAAWPPRPATGPSFILPQPCTITQLCEYWRMTVSYNVKPSTYACYSTIIQKHILPEIGELPVEGFDNQILVNFIREKQHQGLAVSTQRLIIFLIKSMMKTGEEMGRYPAEPLRYYVPRMKTTKTKLMSHENFKILFKRLLQSRNSFELGMLISLCTGIRVGELCGLKWGDIDFASGILQIRRTVSRIRNTNPSADSPSPIGTQSPAGSLPSTGSAPFKTMLYIGAPKTGTSLRDIPLPEFVLSKLKEKKQPDPSYILTGTEKCMEPRGVQRRFKNLLRKSQIPDINIHALRHAFASDWIENGFDSKALSEILGHSSVKITMDIYVHSNMEQKKEYMNRMLVM